MDVKVDFYWRNRAQIEEWAALRSSAVDLLVRELRAQGDALQEVAAVAEDVDYLERDDATLLALTRPSWLASGVALHVGLSWTRGGLLAATGVNRPWAGVHVGGDEPLRRTLFETVREVAGTELKRLSWTNGYSKNWPGWTYMEPDGHDIATFARACGNEVATGWTALAPLLDAAVDRIPRP
jgi:hypothetical protein